MHLQAHAPPVHYWPAAEASHFPVFIKTWPIKFYLQSIIRTPQINQRQLNQCFPGPVPGPHGPHGHSIFSAGLIHGGLQWSHTVHPLACSWLLHSTVPRPQLWSAAYGGSPLRGIVLDFINSPVEVRDEEMNAMFHLVWSGQVGQRWGSRHFFSVKGSSNSVFTVLDLHFGSSVCHCFADLSPSCYVDMWQCVTVMANNGPHMETPVHSFTAHTYTQNEWWVCYWQGHWDNKVLSHWQLH